MFDRICQRVDTRHMRSSVPIVFFNPTPRTRVEVLPLTLYLPRGPAFLFETAGTRRASLRTLEQADDELHIDPDRRVWVTAAGAEVRGYPGQSMDYLIEAGQQSAPVTRWEVLVRIGPVGGFRVAVFHVTPGEPNTEDASLAPDENPALLWRQMLTQPGDEPAPSRDGQGMVEVRPPVELTDLAWPGDAPPTGRLHNPASEPAETVIRCRLAAAADVVVAGEHVKLVGRAGRVTVPPGDSDFQIKT